MILKIKERFNEIVNYWNEIVYDANNGIENEQLTPAKNDDDIYDFDCEEV